MNATFTDIRTFVPVSKIVKAAVNDTYEELDKVESRFTSWAIRGLNELTRQTLKSGKRYAILTVNKNFNHAILPCDFKEELFVGVINNYGEKIALNINPSIVNTRFISEIPCDVECEAHCTDCYSKQLCCDLETTQVTGSVLIDDISYEEKITKTLQSNGEYYILRRTPVKNIQTGLIEYLELKSYLTSFDTKECGCIKETEENKCKLQQYCYDAFCCYCTSCTTGDTDFGGYHIFPENGIIQFDDAMPYSKIYLVYRGMLPKNGNEYLVPEVAFEPIVEWTKFKRIANKKGVPKWERDDQWDAYIMACRRMKRVLGRIGLADLIHSALKVPKFDYNVNSCYTIGAVLPQALPSPQVVSGGPTLVVVQQTGGGGAIVPADRPPIIQITGAQMVSGTVYNNTDLAGIPLVIWADPVGRYLHPGEFTLVPTGGFDVSSIGVYSNLDYFTIFPNW